MTLHLSGLSEIADRYDAFFLDIFGLLHNGARTNPGTLECLKQLKAADKKICLVSNSPKRASGTAQSLKYFGIDPPLYDAIVTAGETVHFELEEKYKNTNTIFLGSSGEIGPLQGLDIKFVNSTEDAHFIFNSLHGNSVPRDELISLFKQAVQKNLKMLCANPDLIVHIGDDLEICPGTYALLYEELGGTVDYYGKPYPKIYDMARKAMGNPQMSRICGIGDALRTDIRGAQDYGIDGIWALTGIYWDELRHADDAFAPDMARVAETLEKSPHKPVATMTSFNW